MSTTLYRGITDSLDRLACCEQDRSRFFYTFVRPQKSMTALRLPFLARLGYFSACIGAALLVRPWQGGDASIVFTFLINIITFPAGLLPTYVAGLFPSGTAAQLGAFLCCTAFWWVFLLLGCGALGYCQWFFLLPAMRRRFRQREA